MSAGLPSGSRREQILNGATARDRAPSGRSGFLNEAHADEVGLVRVLQSQIAMTPRGTYRTALEKHLRETHDHAERLKLRTTELGQGDNPLQATLGVAGSVIAQALAFGKTPFDLLRGSGGEEKVLKNAKDACAAEAQEIATYTAIERLARSVGDETTARLADSIRADEEKMLDRVLREISKLTEAVVRADVKGEGSYDIATTGAADATRAAGTAVKGAVATEQDLPIAGYAALDAEQVVAKLPELSQIELAKVASFERRHGSRSTIVSRIDALRADEPWPGYDELTVAEIRTVLAQADEDRAAAARDYERAHKNRAGVLQTAERELSNA